MINLLDLPEEVLESGIVPLLPWNDLLRCRRVCKTIKFITDQYIKLNPHLAPEIKIDENGDQDMEAFCTMGIPTTKLSINNLSGFRFYERLSDDTLSRFTDVFSNHITSLRVQEYSAHPCFREWSFVESLNNLKNFEACRLGFGAHHQASPQETLRMKHEFVMRAKTDPRYVSDKSPQNFTQLRTVKIGCNKINWIHDIPGRFGNFLRKINKLESISFPFGSKCPETGVMVENLPVSPFNLIVGQLGGCIIGRDRKKENVQLKTFDFKEYHEEQDMQIEVSGDMSADQWMNFETLARICAEFKVKLSNVNPAWYYLIQNNIEKVGHPVVSIVNMHACILRLEMPNLSAINIQQTSRSNVGNWYNRQPWPALQTIRLHVNSKKSHETETPTEKTDELFKFLWKDIVRESVLEMFLSFDERKRNLATIKANLIVSACPNLRKLKIEHWPGTSKQVTTLWSGLSGLEEVHLGHCENLGDIAFVGEDTHNPIFLNLKNLKKFALSGLDRMPKITDTLFSSVLAEMTLTHLIIHSDKPIDRVSLAGVDSMSTRKFAECIEKFPFTGWSLAGVSGEEFKQLSMKFRSYYMT